MGIREKIELSRRTGIATSTISDWRKKKINPQADKLVAICKALDMSLADLLCDEEDKKNEVLTADYIVEENIFIEKLLASSIDVKKRVWDYYKHIVVQSNNVDVDDRNISIVRDAEGNNIVLINDILFKSRRSIDWDEIEQILRKYIGACFEITETAEKVYIGTDFPDEFTHSKYTKAIKGANEKAKANAISAVGDLLQIAETKATYEEIKAYVLEQSGLQVSNLYIAQVKHECGIIERENYNKPKSDDSRQLQCPEEKREAIMAALKHFGMV